MSSSGSSGQKKIIRRAEQLASDPLDTTAMRALARALPGEQRDLAARLLATAARAHAVLGQLPMAIAAAREVEPLDAALGARLVAELAEAYGRGSRRVDAAHRQQPPRPPEPRAAAGGHTTPADAAAGAEAAVARLDRAPLPRFPLFHGLSPASFAKLAAAAAVRDLPAGEIVVEVGSPGESFFVVAGGSVLITRPGEDGADVVLSRLRAGALFGEMALLTESPRTARAACETDAVLLEFPRRGLEEIAGAEPEFAAVLADYTRDRLVANLMITSGLFTPLGEEARAHLVARFQPFSLQPAQTLLVEGEEGGGLFAILAGDVAIEKRSGRDVLTVTRLGPGDVVGEISLITRRPATATVRATTRVHVLGLSREDFNAIVGEYPGVLAHLYQLAIARERDLERFLAEEVVEADDYLI